MSDEAIPEGFANSTLAPNQPARCARQDAVAHRVRAQLEHTKQKLLQKNIHPLFCFELFAFDCSNHGGQGQHVDLVTSGLDGLQADAMPHVIGAIEQLLKALKSRTT